MKRYNPFEKDAVDYEAWFQSHGAIFQSELDAIKKCFEKNKKTIEIGVGTGRFAQSLSIKDGVEPSEDMAKWAQCRGINVIKAVAENLPIRDGTYEQVVMITVDCFLNNLSRAFYEIKRILSERGIFIIAFIDKNAPMGQLYEHNKQQDKFYKWATFHTAEEIVCLLKQYSFMILNCYQTITECEDKHYEVKEGYGTGVFTVIKAMK